MQNVEILSSQIMIYLRHVLGHLMYEKFFFSKCFEFTGGTMDAVVMKNIFLLRYEIHC